MSDLKGDKQDGNTGVFTGVFIGPLSATVFVVPSRERVVPTVIEVDYVSSTPLSVDTFRVSTILPVGGTRGALATVDPLRVWFDVFAPFTTVGSGVCGVIVFMVGLFGGVISGGPRG